MPWALVGLWTGGIWLTVPVARKIQGWLEGRVGPTVYPAAIAVLVALGLGFAWVHLFRARPQNIPRRRVWLIGLGGCAFWIVRTQLQSAIEAIHFLEYGVLGILLFWAWRRHVRDPLVYLVSALSLVLVAWSDEFIQWLVPGRFYDLLDIRLNLLAGGIVLLFIARVVPPGGGLSSVSSGSVRHLGRLAWAVLAALGLSVSTTPARVDRLAACLPFLRFLRNNDSVIIEYGHRLVAPEIGILQSRLSRDELRQADAVRGAETGAHILRTQALLAPRGFLESFTRSADPFLHEYFCHLVLRDHYYATAAQYRRADPARRVWHLTVAFREDQILNRFFPGTLAASGAGWPAERQQGCAAAADLNRLYVSEVGRHLVTSVTEMELWIGLLVLAALVGGMRIRYGREPRARREPAAQACVPGAGGLFCVQPSEATARKG